MLGLEEPARITVKYRRLIMQLGVALAIQLGCVSIASAQSLVGIEHLRIVLDIKKSRRLPKSKKARQRYLKEWQRACNQIGKAVTITRGPWGFGAFGSYSCYRGKKKVDGTEKPTPWTLTVVDGVKGASIELDRGKEQKALISMAPSKYTLKFFLDDEFADLVAYRLMDSVPGGMLVTKAMIRGNPPTFHTSYWRSGHSDKFKYEVPPPPETLILFRLTRDESTKMLHSEVVGTAKRVKVVQPKPRKKGKRVIGLAGGSVVYETTAAVSEALSHSPLWAQNADGPGAREKELSPIIKDAQLNLDAAAQNGQLTDFLKGQGLLTSLFETAASGYVGLRYGLQVLPPQGQLGQLMHKTSILGLLVEIRGGPAKGLRYYYDRLPPVKATLQGSNGEQFETSMTFSRHVLGYSWDFNPGFLVDRITAAPKIGIWNFQAKLPVAVDDQGNVSEVKDFSLDRTLSLALEVGVEELSSWYTLRGWYAIDTGISLLKTGGKITSNRLGVDAFFTAGPTIPLFGVPFKTALMAFYMYEHVSLESGKNINPAPGESDATGATYDSGYAGGGVAISW